MPGFERNDKLKRIYVDFPGDRKGFRTKYMEYADRVIRRDGVYNFLSWYRRLNDEQRSLYHARNKGNKKKIIQKLILDVKYSETFINTS